MKTKNAFLKTWWLSALLSATALAHSPTIRVENFNDCGIPVDPAKELMIVNPLVLEDARANPGGSWHLASLLRQMLPAEATDREFSDFVLRWFQRTKSTTKVNGFDLKFPGLPLGERTVCRWVEELGGKQCNAETINLSRIPYKLIAIVNRVDLNGHGPDQAEGRFIFSAVNRATNAPATDPALHALPETVIFEYHLPIDGEHSLKTWATAWHALSVKTCTTATDCEPYRAALEQLTKKFSSRGLLASRPNGNPLGQVRTSHLAPGSGRLWSFQEFHLEGEGVAADLVLSPVGQTPHSSLDNATELLTYISQNSDAILKEQFVVPRSLLGAQAILDDTKTHQWELNGIDGALRTAFSQQTCNGCHGERKTTDGFFHVSPLGGGNQGQDRLSPYLTEEQLPARAQFLKKLLCER